MKKSELKKIIKPIVEECVRESLFMEGILSSIISEVMVGVSGQKQIVESAEQHKNLPPQQEVPKLRELQENKKKLMDEIGAEAFGGVDLFEGTTPAPAPSSAGSSANALKDIDPNDPGVNIDGLIKTMGNTWRILAKGK